MNPFDVLARVQEEYRTYVQTFQQFQNPVIRDWVMERIQNGKVTPIVKTTNGPK